MALSSTPRYAVFVISLNCMVLCHYCVSLIMIGLGLAIMSAFRWMDGRMERDGWRGMDGEGWMDESRDG